MNALFSIKKGINLCSIILFLCIHILPVSAQDSLKLQSALRPTNNSSAILDCCDDLADDIFDTQTIIIACCKQTQSNFEFTWSLIENLNISFTACCADLQETLSDGFGSLGDKVDRCCKITQSNFKHTFSLLNDLNNTLTTCCAQTQSNFEFTWSLIERICTGSGAFCCDEILNTLSRDFAITWSLIDDLNTTLTTCCQQTQSNFEFTWSLIQHMCTGSGIIFCCDEILSTLSRDFNITWSKIDACCNSTESNFDRTFSLIIDLNKTLTTCCAQTQSNFEFTWSLIENICSGSGAFCCDEILNTLSRDFVITWSLIGDLNTTLTTCCAQTQSNFEFTWSLIQHMCTGSGIIFCCDEILSTLSRDFNITWSKIDACCQSTESNFEFTFSLIIDLNNTLTTCCAQTQSNFEFTWSLIENLATGSVGFCCNEILNTLSRDFSQTFSLIDDLNNTLTICCAQTQSNFEFTWSLIENLATGSVGFCCNEILNTLSRDFSQTFSLIDDLNNTLTTCCAQTQSNFEFTWSLIENLATGSIGFCCNEILNTLSRDFSQTFSLIIDLNNTLTTCCAQTQSNFEFTWSLIENLATGSVGFCCNEILNTLSRDFSQTFSLIIDLNNTLTSCCAQTQSNFEFTWSLIERICTGSGAFCCDEILDTLSRDFAITWSKIDACCLSTQSNFIYTFSLLEDLNNTLTTCCAQTQSNFEFTWSLIERICTGSGAFCCDEILDTLSRDFAITWSKIDACCLNTQSNFIRTFSLLEDLNNTLTTCCAITQSNFEFTWSLIENICTGSGGGIGCCNEILQSLSAIRCSLGCFSDCAICNNTCELCSITGTCVVDCPNCPTFRNASDGISTVFCEIKAVEQLINRRFDELLEILSRIFCRTSCGCP